MGSDQDNYLMVFCLSSENPILQCGSQTQLAFLCDPPEAGIGVSQCGYKQTLHFSCDGPEGEIENKNKVKNGEK